MRTGVGMESSREVLEAALGEVAVLTLPGIRGLQRQHHPFLSRNTSEACKRSTALTVFAVCRKPWSGDRFAFDAHGSLPKVPRKIVLHQRLLHRHPAGLAGTIPRIRDRPAGRVKKRMRHRHQVEPDFMYDNLPQGYQQLDLLRLVRIPEHRHAVSPGCYWLLI